MAVVAPLCSLPADHFAPVPSSATTNGKRVPLGGCRRSVALAEVAPAAARVVTYLFRTPRGRTAVTELSSNMSHDDFLRGLLEASARRDGGTSENEGCLRTKTEAAYVIHDGRVLDQAGYLSLMRHLPTTEPCVEVRLTLRLRLLGGMADRQNRAGSKFGGGGVSSAQQSERERKERLRQLALESVDLARDPYLMRNHLGTYECKLCLTLHTNEGNYLAHTQGKKHQAGLARRAAMEKKLQPETLPALMTQAGAGASAATKRVQRVRIGRPGYTISKSRDPDTNQRCLSFELHYPELDSPHLTQPRHRFMSAFEQRVESPPDRRYQYLLVACDPYETVAFKVPNEPIDRGEGRFVTNWEPDGRRFMVSFYFLDPQQEKELEEKKPRVQ